MGDIFIKMPSKGAAQNYRRELNISDALGKVSYDAGGSHFERTFFGNYPSKVMVYRFTSSTPETYSVRFETPHAKDYEHFAKNQYTFGGHLKDNHQEFETVYRIDTDGKTAFTDGVLTVTGAKSIVLIHTVATDYLMKYPDYKGNDYKKANAATMASVAGKTYATLLAGQQKDYHGLFDRVALTLGSATAPAIPTDQRQKAYAAGQPDTRLEELYFQYGRYLMISSTRPGHNADELAGEME
jgi:alpha-L-fucosidase 2